MNSRKYIGMDVHKESISIAVRNDAGKIRSMPSLKGGLLAGRRFVIIRR
jgi:hypothetical protein